MAERCISYVCIRADHHRRQARVVRLTTHKKFCAFCPAGDAEAHEWLAVPEVTLATLEALGWIYTGRRVPAAIEHPTSRSASS